MSQNQCKDCAYFRQYYSLGHRKIFRVYCGHCVLHRPRKKLPDAAACEHYSTIPPDEYSFATKEYLTKELLQYLLNLELLPQIEDEPKAKSQ